VAGPESRFSPRAVTAQVKEEQALDLRLAGHTYDVIAAQVGYASRSSAYRAVERAFQRIRAHTDQTAEQLRQLEDARYNRMLQAIDDKVQQGDLAAIDRALRISKARRELWGLDAPTRIDTGVSPALAALIEQWQGLREEPALRQALPPADYTEVEGEPLQDIRTPGRTRRADVFHMLDALNQHDLEGDTDGDG
jgi:hypothetical protein